MKREELFERWMAHSAAAAALEKRIKAKVRAAYDEEGSADTWRLAAGSVSASLDHDRVEVVDEEAWLDWVRQHHPDEIVMVPTVRPASREALLGGLLPVDPDELEPGEATSCMDSDGTVVPGVALRRGGTFRSVSLRPDSDTKRRLAAAAEAYASGAGPMPLLELPGTG